MSPFGIDTEDLDSQREEWDRLRGSGNRLDHEKAEFLHGVLHSCLHKNTGTLATYIPGVLGEYPGKRTSMFVRWTVAFSVVSDAGTWEKIGGKGMTQFAQLTRLQRQKVLTRINRIIKKTERTCVSLATFRKEVLQVVGEKKYKRTLVENQTPPFDYKGRCVELLKQCGSYQQALHELIRRRKIKHSDLPANVRELLGLNRARKAAA